jgi:hypothetical protein
MAFFLKNQCYDQIFTKASSSLSKTRQIICQKIAENIFKSITSVPGVGALTNKDGNKKVPYIHIGTLHSQQVRTYVCVDNALPS